MTKSHSAFALIECGNKFALLQKYDRNRWVLPGGNIDEGETPEQAAIRETMEETGLQIKIDEAIGTDEGRLKIRHYFRASVLEGKLERREPDTFRQVKWMNAEGILRQFNNTKLPEIIEDLLDDYAREHPAPSLFENIRSFFFRG